MARGAAPVLNLNGYTDLPPGTVAAIVTYLEMKKRPRLSRIARPPGWSLEAIGHDLGRYRTLFRRVGEPWLWFSRAVMTDEALAAAIAHPSVQAFALTDGHTDIGLLELDFRAKGECELSYFGLIPEAIGRGAGRYLMNEAIRRAFRANIRRFLVHTCSLDHPAALPFYMRCGFVPYKRAVEVAPDPRLLGKLSSDAGPHIPVIGSLARRVRRP